MKDKHTGRNKDKCPKCKCKKIRSTGNMAEPPKCWVNFTCANCGWLVGCIDNSPYVSCYEYDDFVIDF